MSLHDADEDASASKLKPRWLPRSFASYNASRVTDYEPSDMVAYEG